MRIGFSVAEPDPNAELGAAFGRSRAFVIVDTRTGEREVVENVHLDAGRFAGMRAARMLLRHGVDAVVSGMFGAHVARVFWKAEVVTFRVTSGTIDAFLARSGHGKHT